MLERVEIKSNYRLFTPEELPASNPSFTGYIDQDLKFKGIDLRFPKKVGEEVMCFDVPNSNARKLKNTSTTIVVFYQESVVTKEPKLDVIAGYINENGEIESKNLSERNPKWWSRFLGRFKENLKFFKPR